MDKVTTSKKVMPGSLYGDYIPITGEETEEELVEAKRLLVEQACGVIRDIAKEREDFFIIKKADGITTIGWKIFLPTVDI